MKNHKGCRRAFVWTNKAWCDNTTDGSQEIIFGLYHPEGTTSREMSMIWDRLAGGLCPQLQVFDDAWSALASFTDVIAKLSEKDDENITPEQFIKILLSCGFVDDTAYNSPYEPKETALRKELIATETRLKEIKKKLKELKPPKST